MKLTFLGQAGVYLEAANERLLFDPFLTGNPKAVTRPETLNPTYILLTHGHNDHVGDTLPIARRSGATVITTFELGCWLESQGVKTSSQNHGGWGKYPFGRVKFTVAFHSSSWLDDKGHSLYLGEAAGILLQIADKTIYHAGDTALFSDMKLIADDTPIDLALLPIGDFYTMGPRDAAKAVEFLRPKQVIPIHYGTFPPIEVDPNEFVKLVEPKGTRATVLRPGEAVEI
jgi:L-ascorbate metabolism protein UlaG (beta-lactamase superfamily)